MRDENVIVTVEQDSSIGLTLLQDAISYSLKDRFVSALWTFFL